MKNFLPVLAALALLVSFLLPIHAADAPAKPRKNVVFIMADDLNVNLGCYGHPVVKSLNIDRLTARSVRFDAAYCNYPVCNPSRTSLLSGRRPDTTGVLDNATPTRTYLKDTVFLPEYFRQRGYRTIKVGKIFHTGDQFEDPRSWDVDIREKGTSKKPPAEQIVRRQGPAGIVLNAEDANTWDGFVARKAVELLEASIQTNLRLPPEANRQPIFLAVGFRRPHSPYIAPQKYFDMYDPAKLMPRLGPPEHLKNIPDLALSYRMGQPTFPTDHPGDTMAAYWASVSFMDAQVGYVMQALDRLKLWDNTVVVFTSDHGYHLGEHGGLWHKMALFEETTHVPLVVAVSGKSAGAVAAGLVEHVDLYPTLVDLCGLETPEGLEGVSFAPLLEKPERSWKQAVFTVITREKDGKPAAKGQEFASGRTVFTGQWRYTAWSDGTSELYDHRIDPLEYKNLAMDAMHAAKRAELQKLLADGGKAALPK